MQPSRSDKCFDPHLSFAILASLPCPTSRGVFHRFFASTCCSFGVSGRRFRRRFWGGFGRLADPPFSSAPFNYRISCLRSSTSSKLNGIKSPRLDHLDLGLNLAHLEILGLNFCARISSFWLRRASRIASRRQSNALLRLELRAWLRHS